MRKVYGNGPMNAAVMFIGEAPGRQEAAYGQPFIGKTGGEFNETYLPLAGLQRSQVRVDNIFKYRPPGNRTPSAAEIEQGWKELYPDILKIRPQVIVPMGAAACSKFDLPADLQSCHGVPYMWENFIIFPMYHPAYGIHDGAMMRMLLEDFGRLGALLSGSGRVEIYVPTTQETDYVEVKTVEELLGTLPYKTIVAIDTETVDGKIFSIQLSSITQTGEFIDASNPTLVKELGAILNTFDILVVLHNAPYDLRMLQQVGITPRKFIDTMSMCYLLGEPKGLKANGFRHFQVHMTEYEDLVRDDHQAKVLEYLNVALDLEWADSPKVEKIVKGRKKLIQPQNIKKGMHRLMLDILSDKAVDIQARWNALPHAEVEEVFGPLPQGTIAGVDRAKLIQYGCQDADITLRLYNKLWPRIVELGMEDTLRVDMQCIPVLVEMENTGMLIDREHFAALSADLHTRQDKIFDELQTLMRQQRFLKQVDVKTKVYKQVPIVFKMTGEVMMGKNGEPRTKRQAFDEWHKEWQVYNPNSPMDCARYCQFLKLNVKSTEAKYLQPYAEKHKGLALHFEYKQAGKLLSTYVDKFPEIVDKDDRLHCRLSITTAETGRLSSYDPNLQNVPTRTVDGNRVRLGFVARPGWSLVSIDYKQIEPRITAHLSQDAEMLNIFRNNLDPYVWTACKIYGLKPEEVDDNLHRRPMKSIYLGITYGLTGKGLYEALQADGITSYTLNDCFKLIEEFMSLYVGFAEWQQGIDAEARITGMVKDMFGRVRFIPEVNSYHEDIQQEGLRKAYNVPIQSAASGIIKRVMAKLWRDWAELHDRSKVLWLVQLHDELLFEMHDSVIDLWPYEISEFMATGVTLSIPTPCDVEIRKRWGKE